MISKERLISCLNHFYPWLTIELTNLCNLKCIMCYKDDFDSVSKCFIELKYVKKTIQDIRKSNMRFYGIKPGWLGEPSLHPQFYQIIKEICHSSDLFDNFAMDTNLNTNDVSYIDLFKDFKNPVFLTISIDSIYSETYSKIRKNGSLSLLLKNLDYILKNRSDNVFLRFQIIINEKNYNEIEDFTNFFQNKFKDINIYTDEKTDLREDYIFLRRCIFPPKQRYYDEIFEKYCKKYNSNSDETKVVINGSFSNICSKSLTMPIIRCNGELGFCNNDPEMKLSLGNIKKDNFVDLWIGNKINKIRKDQIEGIYSSRCKNCDVKACDIKKEKDKELMNVLS